MQRLFPCVFPWRLKSVLGIVCALAVAVVSTFHVCGFASSRGSLGAPGLYAAAVDAPLGDTDVSPEKCHICAVVSLPVEADMDTARPADSVVPAGRLIRLVSLQPQSTAPPPRT